ncbi:MAG: hypothetical protein IKX54_03865 [Lachnospiraceae bacterium]|nr:hypothetical protein [Lachnospiraceae bacterium]
MKRFWIITKLELLNVLGINVYRNTRDPRVRRKQKVMYIVFAVLALILTGYLAGYSFLLSDLGIKERIPTLLTAIASVVFLAVGTWRARGVIFREKDLGFCSALPVTGRQVVGARMLRLYIGNVLIGLFMLVPGLVLCGVTSHAGPLYYVGIPLVCLVMPMLPTVLAAWVGIVVSAIVARNRHKVLTEVILAVVVVTGVFVLSGLLSAKVSPVPGEKLSNREMSEKIVKLLDGALGSAENAIPPLRTASSLVRGGKCAGILLWGVISAGAALFSVFVLGRFFFGIARNLYDVQVHREFRLETMKRNNILTALVKKECSRYFSCGIYVANTILGAVISVVLAVCLGFVDIDSLVKGADVLPVAIQPKAAIPYIIAILFLIGNVAASSVSIEGKNWWIMLSLPVRAKDVLRAKLLFSLILFAPFYLVTEIILLFTVRATVLERLWIVVIPAVLITFSAVLGLWLNTRFAKFEWDTPTEVVKQSAAVGFSMLILFAAILPCGGAMVVPDAFRDIFNLCVVIAVSVVSVFTFRAIQAVRLERL